MSAPAPAVEPLAQALRDCLAWGRAYAQAIPRHQWEEMRERQVKQHLEALGLAGIPDPLATFRQARNAIESLRMALRRHTQDGFDVAAMEQGLEALKAISKGNHL